jgi:hypothetical protein
MGSAQRNPSNGRCEEDGFREGSTHPTRYSPIDSKTAMAAGLPGRANHLNARKVGLSRQPEALKSHARKI